MSKNVSMSPVILADTSLIVSLNKSLIINIRVSINLNEISTLRVSWYMKKKK